MLYKQAFQTRIFGSLMLMFAGTILLSGCALNSGVGSSSGTGTSGDNPTTHTGRFAGLVHGGQQPVTGSTVILWAAGTTGAYGTGATKIASTTTASDGSFTFDNGSGVSPCTTGQYLYLTSTGGNSGGGINNSIALMAAIPQPCSATTGATSVFIDEVTTIAAVTALQQFMSINTAVTPPYTGSGTVPWTVGAPSTNTTGLANAFLQTANLASIATGSTGESFPSNTVSGTLYTTTINPDSQKINGLANILATCINDSTGNLCTGSAGVLTLTTITNGGTTPTNTVPVDTIQSAYNMATLPNPALYSGSRYWNNSTSSVTYLSTLWSNISATAPFQPYYATTPVDTTIGVAWKTQNPSNGAVGTVYAASVAIDGKGNIWTGGGSGTAGNYVNQFNQAGLLLLDVSTANIPSYTLSYFADSTTAATATTTANASYALGYGRPFSLAVDTNNNAWFDAYGATSPGTLTSASLISGLTVQVSQTGTATGYLTGSSAGALAIDGSNNLFMSDIPVSGRYYLSGVPAAASYQSVYEGIGRGTGIYNNVAIDNNNYAWGFSSTTTCTSFAVPRINNALMLTTTGTSTGTVTLPSNCAYDGAGDANGNMWFTDNANLYYANIGSSLTATVNATFTGGAATGLYSPYGMAVDGSGNLWVSNKGVTNTVAGVAKFATNGTTGTVTQLSPAGTGVAGFGSSAGFSINAGAPEGVAIDSSGNIWFETTAGSYLYYLVGVASPVKTPLASMYGSIGTRP